MFIVRPHFDIFSESKIKEHDSPIDVFTKLVKTHHLDVLNVSGNVFPKLFYPNINCPYTQHLFAVLLLKSIGKFDNLGKLTNVHNLTRGTAADHDNIGIEFNFNGEAYYFAGITPPRQGNRIAHAEAQIDIVKALHKMDVPYAISYKLDGNSFLR